MNENGMTKIEVLVVVLIIGLLGLLSAFAVSTARARTRDTTRLAHVRELQDALESFYSDVGTYPTEAEPLALGQSTTLCLSADDGFRCSIAPDGAYLNVVPATPRQGLNKRSSCGSVANAYCYQGDGVTYAVQFELEKSNNPLGLQKGANCMTPEKLVPGACASLTE